MRRAWPWEVRPQAGGVEDVRGLRWEAVRILRRSLRICTRRRSLGVDEWETFSGAVKGGVVAKVMVPHMQVKN